MILFLSYSLFCFIKASVARGGGCSKLKAAFEKTNLRIETNIKGLNRVNEMNRLLNSPESNMLLTDIENAHKEASKHFRNILITIFVGFIYLLIYYRDI